MHELLRVLGCLHTNAHRMGQNHDVYALVSIVGICVHEPRILVPKHRRQSLGHNKWFFHNDIVRNRLLLYDGMVALGKWYTRIIDIYDHHRIVSKTNESISVRQFYQRLARVGHVTDLFGAIYTTRRIVILSI